MYICIAGNQLTLVHAASNFSAPCTLKNLVDIFIFIEGVAYDIAYPLITHFAA